MKKLYQKMQSSFICNLIFYIIGMIFVTLGMIYSNYKNGFFILGMIIYFIFIMNDAIQATKFIKKHSQS